MPSSKVKREIRKWNVKNEKKQQIKLKNISKQKQSEESNIEKWKTKKNPKSNIWILLNPRNLQKEVHAFGYHFSEVTHLLTILMLLVVSAGLGIIFQLKWEYTLVIAMIACLLLPFFILDMYKRMYEQKRFAQATQYVEQMLFSFHHSQKIYYALHDCLNVFEDGFMREKILEAIAYIDRGVAETSRGILWEAVTIIEQAFPGERIKNMHQLLLAVEERGGEYQESEKLLLDSNSQWQRRGYALQADKKRRHVEVTFSIITSLILSLAVLYSLRWMGTISDTAVKIQIFSYPLIQFTSCIFLIFLILVYYKSSHTLTNDWIIEKPSNERVIFSSYEYVMKFIDKKEQMKSCMFALIPLMVGIIAYSIGHKWFCVGLLFVSVFLLFQHRIGYSIAKTTVVNQLYLSFPKWLMDMALLLQNNNVYVSLNKSQNNADAVLKKELQLLIHRIDEQPKQIKSYTKCLQKFDVSEIYACMKMLYNISESGEGDAKQQIQDLLLQIQEMEKKAERILHEHIKFQLEKIFFYPIAAVCLKMSLDMAFGMVLMLSSFQHFFSAI